MSRPLRIEYPGALYHITTRGNKKQSIFIDDFDRVLFLQILAETIKIHHWSCYAYCLMGNHFHLLIETIDPTLSAGMHRLNGIYTQRYNKKHNTVGHVFQGRFHTVLVEKELYLLEISRYIVLNPVRAGLVVHPKEWRWSSYCATAGLINSPKFLSKDALISCFTDDQWQAQQSYISFVADRMENTSPFDDVQHGMTLGSPQFVHSVWEQKENIGALKDISREQRMLGRLSLEEIFLDTQSKKDRDKAIYLARNVCAYSHAQIGRFLGLSASTISDIVNGKNRRSKA